MIKDAILKEKAKAGQKVVIANSIRISIHKIDEIKCGGRRELFVLTQLILLKKVKKG